MEHSTSVGLGVCSPDAEFASPSQPLFHRFLSAGPGGRRVPGRNYGPGSEGIAGAGVVPDAATGFNPSGPMSPTGRRSHSGLTPGHDSSFGNLFFPSV